MLMAHDSQPNHSLYSLYSLYLLYHLDFCPQSFVVILRSTSEASAVAGSQLSAHGSLLIAQSLSILSLPSIPFKLLPFAFRRQTAKHKRSIRGSRLKAQSSLLTAHSPITLYTLLSGAAVVLPQPPKFLDATPKFLDVIVVKQQVEQQNIRSFTPKSDTFHPKKCHFLPKTIRHF